MLGRRSLSVVALALVPLIARADAVAGQRKIRVAVLEIRPLGTETAKAELLSEIALTEAAGMGAFEVIGRSDISSMIGFEKQKQVLGCSEDSTCLAEIGGALGVDFILVGSLGRIGKLYRLDLKLVDTKKSRVRNRIGVNVEGREESLVAATQRSIRDLLGPEVPRVPVAAKGGPTRSGAALEARPEEASAGVPPGTNVVEPGAVARGAASPIASRRTWAYVAGGIGVGLLTGGAVAGLQARSSLQDEKNATTLQTYEDSRSKVKSRSLLADSLFAAGTIGVGAGTYLFFSSRAPDLAFGASPIPGGAIASLSGGF